TDKINAIEFELPQSAREIRLQDYVESPGVVGFYIGTLHVQDGLVAAFGTTSPQQALYINVYGYRQNLMWVIDPGLEGFDRPVSLFSHFFCVAQDDERYQWDMFTWGEDWILFREDQKNLIFHAWFDILRLFAQMSELPGVLQTITRPSDSSRTIELANPKFASGFTVDWITIHPWNTPNHRTRNLIPASGSARILGGGGALGSERLMYRHDINPAYISHLLSAPPALTVAVDHKHLRQTVGLDGANVHGWASARYSLAS
ncbi:hypothetical protein FRC00_011039, partial [Tulasnella sp. 408]